MLPTPHQDVWKPASETDKLAALASLAKLPTRDSTDPELDRDIYLIALDGTTRYGLGQAVKAILQNALGHPFFPHPPELRGECDRAMEHHRRMRERILHQERMERERPTPLPPITPELRARQEQRMRDFHASLDNSPENKLLKEREEIRARYGMTDEVLASLPDIELQKTWRKSQAA